MESNFIRGGMCLIFSEGLAQKAAKGLRLLKGIKEKGIKSTGWDFLDQYIILHKKREKGTTDMSPTYIKDLVAGRPVFGHPSRSGGFRFRYGRSRVNGFSAASIHPATMGISNDFLSTGTQLKIEKPTKGCVVTVCDSIDGPIVKLKDGSVKRVLTYEESKRLYKDIEQILYFGDILFPLGDVMNRNYELLKPGYVEEWWSLELGKKFEITGEKFEENIREISIERAMELSDKYSVPLHPRHIFFWNQISKEDFFWLLDWLQNAGWRSEKKDALILPYHKSVRDKFKEAKRALEILGIEHDVVFDNVIVEEAQALLANLGIEVNGNLKEQIAKIVLEQKKYMRWEHTHEVKIDFG